MKIFLAENKSQQPVATRIPRITRFSPHPNKNQPSQRRTLGDVTNQTSLDKANASNTSNKERVVVVAKRVPPVVTESKESETVPIISPSVSPTATTIDAATSPPEETSPQPAFQRFDPVCFSDKNNRKRHGRIFQVHTDENNKVFSYLIKQVPGEFFDDIPEDSISPSTNHLLHPGTESKNVFWDSKEAFKLFSVNKGESVWDAIEAQIEILDKVNKTEDGWMCVVQGGESHPHLFTSNDIDKIKWKAFYLNIALRTAKRLMPGCGWMYCCAETCKILAGKHNGPYKSGVCLSQVYVAFRRRRIFECPQGVASRIARLPLVPEDFFETK